MSDDTHDESEGPQPDSAAKTPPKKHQLSVVKAKRAAKKTGGARSNGFKKGNQLWKNGSNKRPTDPLEYLDKIVITALTRLTRLEYETVLSREGKEWKRQIPLSPGKATAISNLVGRKLELDRERAGSLEVQRIRQELAEMTEVVQQLMQGRAG